MLWCVLARLYLYNGIAKDGEGRAGYLNERKLLIPEKRYAFPLQSSWRYGWMITEQGSLYNKPACGRANVIQTSFFGRNGIPKSRRILVPRISTGNQ